MSNILRSRFGQSLAIASTAIVLATFPIQKPLADELPKQAAPVSQKAESKEDKKPAEKKEQGTLKLSTNSYKVGDTIWVDVVDDKGKQIKGETVKVISPSGEESTVYISNELNGFVLEESGHYKLFYRKQEQMICVAPSSAMAVTETISVSAFDALIKSSKKYSFSFFAVSAEDAFQYALAVGFGNPNATPPEPTKQTGVKVNGVIAHYEMHHRGRLLIIQYGNVSTSFDLIESLKLIIDARGSQFVLLFSDKPVVRENPDGTISFLIATSRDGTMGVKVDFDITALKASLSYIFTHDDSICPLSTTLPANPVQ